MKIYIFHFIHFFKSGAKRNDVKNDSDDIWYANMVCKYVIT